MSAVYSRSHFKTYKRGYSDSPSRARHYDLRFLDLEDDVVELVLDTLCLPDLIRIGRTCRALWDIASALVRHPPFDVFDEKLTEPNA
jgi:hypothetical protein